MDGDDLRETARRSSPERDVRELGDAEAEALRTQLVARFGLWYGGCVDRAGVPDHVTFASDRLPEAAPDELRPLIARRAPRVFVLSETGPGHELDIALATFTESEAFWLDASLAWMVYASHELTLTVAGPALVAAVHAELPHWLDARVPDGPWP